MTTDTILVTGGTGNIGTAFVAQLAAEREVRHVGGGDAFSARCKELGVPDTAKHFYGQAGEGWFATIDDAIFVRVLGRHTTPFAKFAIDYRAHFVDGQGD